MKLATFTHQGKTRIGVVKGDAIVDLSAAAPSLPTEMIGFLEAGDAAMDAARKAADDAATIPLSDVTLEAPVLRPGKVLACGLNYMDHVKESGMEVPKHQIWFTKQHNCINAPYAPIELPEVSSLLDYEAEMCFVIGKRCKDVPKERAHEVIAGYFVGDDVSVRDWQLRANAWTMGKSFDTHGPIGPWITTADEVPDPHALDIKCWVNGELRQNSNTKHLIFNCFDQIVELSTAFTLDVGDVIFSGTSSGVGGAMKPPQFLKEGDAVRVEVEGLGAIENKVVAQKKKTIIG